MLKKGEMVQFFRQKDYEVLNPNLGGGSFGKTIIIRDNLIDEIFVCKKYEPFSDDAKKEFYDTFVSEIKIMHKLYHENIVRVFNYYLYPDQYSGYILMEFIEGKEIDEFFSDDIFKIFSDVNHIFLQLIDAFVYLEKNSIIHRDIRASNILVSQNDVVKVIDFGLGKSLQKQSDNIDTFKSIINRQGMEIVPEEFGLGYYDNLTDMFCLGELFNRLIKQNNIGDFKYTKVLQKMMKVSRSDRYSSFKLIKSDINTKKLATLDINEKDKTIYQLFTNGLKNSISVYRGDPQFNYEIDEISNGLKSIISTNLLEEEIQRKDILIRVFVKSAYKYFTNVKILTKVVSDFYNWFIDLDEDDKVLIIESIIQKIGNIKVISDEDLPF
ncbi:MAG: protein kinase family protein [Candidatus Cloacimonetes bacterium]|nr:protein kinase family protein [Candidatus Cloacimonadota bacterium]